MEIQLVFCKFLSIYDEAESTRDCEIIYMIISYRDS